MTLTRRQENELERLISILGETTDSRLQDVDSATVRRVASVAYEGLISMRSVSPGSREFEEDGIERQLAGKLYLSIKRLRNIQAPNLDSWARVIDLMIRKDGHGVVAIKHAIEYLPKDKFWRTVILSAKGLRKHFARIDGARKDWNHSQAVTKNARSFLNEKKRRPIY